MTYSLDLLFREPSRDGPPGPRIAQIYLRSHTTDEKGNILITPHCISMTELEGQIERLRGELEVIRKKGKSKFGKQDR